jgi:Domain of unknown function (DUF4440)
VPNAARAAYVITSIDRGCSGVNMTSKEEVMPKPLSRTGPGDPTVTKTADLAPDALDELLVIERSLWTNDADTYHDGYSPDALLIFPGVGRIDRDTAVAAIRRENAEGRAWVEVRLADVDGRWLVPDVAVLLTYVATARWNYETRASDTLCATVYVRLDGVWRVVFHQQTDGTAVPAPREPSTR